MAGRGESLLSDAGGSENRAEIIDLLDARRIRHLRESKGGTGTIVSVGQVAIGSSPGSEMHRVSKGVVQANPRSLADQVAELQSQVAALASGRGRVATPDERARWTEYLLSLETRHRDGVISAYQAKCVLDTWQRAIEIEPNVMYPTAGTTEDGDIYLAWNPPGRTLTLEVFRDGVDWFYEDLATNDRDGSESVEATPPPRFYTYLRGFPRR